MKIALLGCGNMGRAIISGLLAKDGETAIIAFDKNDKALTALPDQVLVLAPEEWYENENVPDAVIIAVKPQDVEEALIPLTSRSDAQIPAPLWISIAAGVNLNSLESFLSTSAKICRVMPNTPALIGEAMSALAFNAHCDENDRQLAEDIVSACGKTVVVPEKLMNAVTGLSGSGPAYVYLFIEALIEGGVSAGLPYAVAKDCAVQTVIGAARMVEQSEESASSLKAKVMSPGGTTVRGLMALEENKFKYGIMKAVMDATERAVELGKPK
jgi:pyrroline-5-carboxylate reductase